MGRGATRGRPGGAGGVWRRRRRGAGRREVGDGVEGNFVNKSKFKNQFCNFKFSPSSGPQMKKCLIPLLLSFSRSTTFVLCTFSFEQWFESYLIISKTAI